MTGKIPTFFALLAPALVCAQTVGQAASADRIIDACSLLSSAEISKSIGVTVDSGHRHDEGMQPDGSYSSTCMWQIEENVKLPLPGRGHRFVILSAIQWPAGRGLAHTYLQAFHNAAENGDIPHKPKPRRFGDEALWWGDGLAVRKGDLSFGISVFMPRANSPRSSVLEERLAPHILRNIDERVGGPV
jgi:hypothetical protein